MIDTSVEDGLRAWAKGDYTLEASVELLIRTGWTRRGDFYEDAIEGTGTPGQWWIDFERVGQALRGDRDAPWLAASGGELRVLRIGYSLAHNGLGNNIAGLDRNNVALVLAAIAHASGSHDHSVPRYNADRTAIKGFDQPGSLYPWPS